MRDFEVYLEDIITAINSIEEYTKKLTYSKFANDKKTIDAVIRNFEIIGETTKHIPERVKIKPSYCSVEGHGGIS